MKFLQAYAHAGVPVQMITPQNEPSNGVHGTSYPGLTLPETQMAAFIAKNLAPAIRAAGLPVKIYGGDLSWNAESYEARLLASAAGPALAGIASHCYGGAPTAMTVMHNLAPTLDQIATECSSELAQIERPEYLISSLRNWASLVTVWNLALDLRQGPKVKLNGCHGCYGVAKVLPSSRTWKVGSEYYQLGQVSKFVQPGADRISSRNFVAYGVNGRKLTITGDLDDVAFLNPDGSRVLIAYNHATKPTDFGVAWHGRAFKYRLAPRAMVTFKWTRRA